MEQNHSDVLPEQITIIQLDAWVDILPARCRILGANLFADVFLADSSGAVHMLEVAAGSVSPIAASEDEFRHRCVKDADGWLLRPLVDLCRSTGLVPGSLQCYAFTTLPLFGGVYTVENIWVCGSKEWLSFTASAYSRTKGLPDGSAVEIVIVD